MKITFEIEPEEILDYQNKLVQSFVPWSSKSLPDYSQAMKNNTELMFSLMDSMTKNYFKGLEYVGK